MLPIIFILFIITILLFYKIQVGFALAIVLCLLMPSAPGESKLHFVRLSLSAIICIALFCNILSKGYYKINNKGKMFAVPIIIFFTGLIMIAICAREISFLRQLRTIAGLFTGYFIFCYIAWYIYDNPNKINQFANIMFITSLLLAIYGLFCYFTSSNPYISYIDENMRGENQRQILALAEEERAGLTGRIQGTLNHPISWGGCCFLLFIYFLRTKMNTSFSVAVKPILLLLLIINVVLSGSRSAILGLFVYFACVFFFNTRKEASYYLISIISIAAIIIAINTIPALSPYKTLLNSTLFFWNDTLAANNDISGSSVSMRIGQLIGSFSMIGVSFLTILTGLGQGFTNLYLIEYGTHPILRGFESIFFQEIINGGIIGVFLWSYIFYTMFHNIKRMSWNYKMQHEKIISLKSYVLAYIVFILFTGLMQTFLCFLVLYVLQVKELMIKNQRNTMLILGEKGNE